MAVSIPVYTVKGVFLSFLGTLLEFTCQMLGATYVCLLLAGNHSPLPITLLSAVTELSDNWAAGQRSIEYNYESDFRLCLSISVPRQNM